MSNLERQRRFRASHPGYFNKYHGRLRAMNKAAKARVLAMMQVMAEKPEPLMLPAPVEIVEIPGMTTIPATPALSPLPVSEQATIASPGAKSIAA